MDVERPQHEVRVLDGRFAWAECSCGWRSSARRERRAVRQEARDHALLYADGRAVVLEVPRSPSEV